MMGVLGSWLRGRVTGQIFGLLLALTGLMQLLELLEISTDPKHKLGLTGLLHYAMLRIPGVMLLALPLAVLLGSMSAFYAMARSREITALRSAGIGLTRLLVYLLPVPLLFALLQVGLYQWLAPTAEAGLNPLLESTESLENRPLDPKWMRTSNGVLLFERHSADGIRLLGVRIYSRDAQGLLTLRTSAKRAEWDGSQWRLSEARDLHVEPGMAPTRDDWRAWQSNVGPEDVMLLDTSDPHLSSMDLLDVIGGEKVGTRPRSFYQTVFLQSFTAPFSVFIMMLLALPAAIVSERGGGGLRVLLALGLGLGFVLLDGIATAFGKSEAGIPPLLAATVAPLLFAALGFWQLRNCERH